MESHLPVRQCPSMDWQPWLGQFRVCSHTCGLSWVWNNKMSIYFEVYFDISDFFFLATS